MDYLSRRPQDDLGRCPQCFPFAVSPDGEWCSSCIKRHKVGLRIWDKKEQEWTEVFHLPYEDLFLLGLARVAVGKPRGSHKIITAAAGYI